MAMRPYKRFQRCIDCFVAALLAKMENRYGRRGERHGSHGRLPITKRPLVVDVSGIGIYMNRVCSGMKNFGLSAAASSRAEMASFVRPVL